MKKFNVVCMAALLACGTHCTSNLHAESTELPETYNDAVDPDSSADTVEQTTTDNYIEAEVTTTSEVYNCIDEDIADDVEEIAAELSVANQVNTNDVAVVVVAATQEQVIVEDNLDTMVNELVQSGAVNDDLSTLENQPKWKLLLARIGSYALSMGVSCKELLMNVYTNIQTNLTNYWSNNKKA